MTSNIGSVTTGGRPLLGRRQAVSRSADCKMTKSEIMYLINLVLSENGDLSARSGLGSRDRRNSRKQVVRTRCCCCRQDSKSKTRSRPTWTETEAGPYKMGLHRRTAWRVQRGRRRPRTARTAGGPSLKQLLGRFRGGPSAGRRREGHGGPKRNFRKSRATHSHTPMVIQGS
jgi:hypothetical protein